MDAAVVRPICSVDWTNLRTRSWHTQKCFMGIDEAGRGPVLGPMVYACCFASLEYRTQLASQKYADSKTLTAEKRDQLLALLQQDENVGYLGDVISAKAISAQMLAREKVSLNAIATTSTIKLIQAVLDAGVNLTEVYIDTVGDADRYASKLSSVFPSLEFTVCPKADSLYPIVSAASIVAKVTRDRCLEASVAGCSTGSSSAGSSPMTFGSGYPGDPDTIKWLKAHMDPVFGFPDIARFVWETCNRVLQEEAVKVGWECEDEASDTPRLTFAKPGAKGVTESNAMGRHSFFRVRKLQQVDVM